MLHKFQPVVPEPAKQRLYRTDRTGRKYPIRKGYEREGYIIEKDRKKGQDIG